MTTYPPVRGTLTPHRPLADLTWLRVGGPADALFQPADPDDLSAFLQALDPAVRIFPIGVGSNLIVRDGGIRAVVIRLGRGFNAITVDGNNVTAGAAALDAHVARTAAEHGLDLTYLRTIPGTIGGAVRMNAGCYGHYTADFLEEITAVTRGGEQVTIPAADLQSPLPPVRPARRLGHHRGHLHRAPGRSRHPCRPHGGPARQTRCLPADEGPLRRFNVP